MGYVDGELGSRTVKGLDGTVHAARWLPTGALTTLCNMTTPELATRDGFPQVMRHGLIDCMACLAELTK